MGGREGTRNKEKGGWIGRGEGAKRECGESKTQEEGEQLTGLTSRYHFSLGVSKSIITSSYGNPSSLIVMCALWAHGQPWFVYRVILGVDPFVSAMMVWVGLVWLSSVGLWMVLVV